MRAGVSRRAPRTRSLAIGLQLVAALPGCAQPTAIELVAASSDEGSSGDAPPEPGAFDPDPAWERWSLRLPDYAVPAVETTYVCAGASFEIDGLGHVVAFAPVVDEARVVHHMVLARSAGPVDLIDPCYPAPPQATMQWGWAPGAGAFELPADAGFLVGDEGSPVHWVLQIHYNNPLGEAGIVDASGVDIYVTRELRPDDAGVFGLGDVAGLLIPPGWPDWHTAHVCSSASTRMLLHRPARVFGSWLHAHTLGVALWTEHSRDGVALAPLGERIPFRFDDQEFAALDAVVEPGDELVTHCVYDSTSRTEPTYGGGATTDEMCLNYLLYHPRQPLLTHCNDP